MKHNTQRIDSVLQFKEAKDALIEEKTRLEARLHEINAVLVDTVPVNKMSLKEAIFQALKQGPLTKQQILEKVQREGYHFVTKKPMNSLNVILYSGSITHKNGLFALPTKKVQGKKKQSVKPAKPATPKVSAKPATAKKASTSKAKTVAPDTVEASLTPAPVPA